MKLRIDRWSRRIQEFHALRAVLTVPNDSLLSTFIEAVREFVKPTGKVYRVYPRAFLNFISFLQRMIPWRGDQ